jgi:hypothetical protein
MLTFLFPHGFNISDLLSFDPASVGLPILGAKEPQQQQPIDLTNQLQRIKSLLSAPIGTLVNDSKEIKHILEQIEPQLPESLQVKLWPAGYLPCF